MTINLALLGAAGFGVLIGWYVYIINRYRKGDVQFSDLVTLIGVIGGATVVGLFGGSDEKFGAYGIGLFLGFFAYFVCLLVFVGISKSFTVDWFLDGRRENPAQGWGYGSDVRPTVSAMSVQDLGAVRKAVNDLKVTVDSAAKSAGLPD